jgi:hypothetical protein
LGLLAGTDYREPQQLLQTCVNQAFGQQKFLGLLSRHGLLEEQYSGSAGGTRVPSLWKSVVLGPAFQEWAPGGQYSTLQAQRNQ